MFLTKPFIVMDLVDMHPRAINGEEDKRGVDLVFKIAPFSLAHAKQLGEDVVNVLYTGGEVERAGLRSATFKAGVEPQRLKFGPKDAVPELELKRVEINEIVVKPQTDQAGYVATIKASFEFPTDAELMKLTAGLGRKHFVSCEDEDPSLLPKDDDAKTAKKRGPRAA